MQNRKHTLAYTDTNENKVSKILVSVEISVSSSFLLIGGDSTSISGSVFPVHADGWLTAFDSPSNNDGLPEIIILPVSWHNYCKYYLFITPSLPPCTIYKPNSEGLSIIQFANIG